MRTHNIPHVRENRKHIPIMPPDLRQGFNNLTLISSNYPCLELIFMAPKVFKPLKFDYIVLLVIINEIESD